MAQYVYLIQEREFVVSKEPVYKLGKTTQTPGQRMAGYPKSSEVHLYMLVKDCHTMEKCLISLFDRLFIQRSDFGREYYEGNVNQMKKEFMKCVSVDYENTKDEPVQISKSLLSDEPKPRSFTAKLIEDNFNLYTDDMKCGGIKGLVDFIELIATYEGSKIFACSDFAKKKFRRMVNGEWKDDSGGATLFHIFRIMDMKNTIDDLWNLKTDLLASMRDADEAMRVQIETKTIWLTSLISACKKDSLLIQKQIIKDLAFELSFRLGE